MSTDLSNSSEPDGAAERPGSAAASADIPVGAPHDAHVGGSTVRGAGRTDIAPRIALVVTFIVVALASFFPDRRVWGLNHLAFYPAWVRAIVLVAVLACFASPIARALQRASTSLCRHYIRDVESSANTLALSGAVSLLVFAVLRSATLLWGDGVFIRNSYELAVNNDLGLSRYFQVVTLKEHIYPLTDLLDYAASIAASNAGGVSPMTGVWLMSCLAGTAFTFGIIGILRRGDRPIDDRTTLAAVAVVGGAAALFFGYVEYYTPMIVVASAAAYAAWRCVCGRGGVLVPGALLLLAALLHIEALLFAPAWLFLAVWRWGLRGRSGRPALLTASIIVVVTLGAVGYAGLGALNRYYLPLRGAAYSYGIISPTHLVDVFNVLTLLCPLWLVIAVLAWGKRPAERAAEHGHGRVAGLLLAVAALPCLLFVLCFRPELGMARDWDLFAVTAIPLGAAAFAAFRRFLEAHKSGTRSRAVIVVPATALSLLLFASWVGILADVDRSVARFEAILSFDATNAGYAYEALAKHHEARLETTRQIAALRSAYDASRNPRFLVKIGRAYFGAGNDDAALKAMEGALAAHPEYAEARKFLLVVLDRSRRYEDLVEASRGGVSRSPSVPEYHFYLGKGYLETGRFERALSAFEACARLDPPASMVREMRRLIERAVTARDRTRSM